MGSQGSVLGPLLFTLYTTQIYLSLSKTDPEMSLSLVQQCLQDVSDWMIASKLKLNPDKTEFILIGTKAQRDKFKKYFPTKLLDQDVTPTDSAQNLGVKFDKDFNFKKHISKVCRSCYYHIRDLRRLRRCLTAAVTETIATSLVSSKLDYWLPVQFRIKHKICTLTYKVIHSCQPVYLHNLLKPLNRTRNQPAPQMMINWLFPECVQGWVKGLFRLRPPSSGIVSLLRLKNLNLHSHFGRN